MAFKLQISEAEFAELAKPKLRLFMSVDVVGSTAFKHQSEKADAQGWLDFFTAFFGEFPDFLLQERVKALKSANRSPGDLPPAPLWKALGDELVFVTELSHSNQAELHLTAFRNAVCRAVTHFVHEQRLPINFKATAWLAGFPVGNAAVPTDEDSAAVAYDFVGPSIDIGFRLASLATPRRFIVSVELAYLILVAHRDKSAFHYEGKQALRGVLNNRGYPILWLDNYDGIEEKDRHAEHLVTKAEDELKAREAAKPDKLRDFCNAYIDEIGLPLMKPFIDDEKNGCLPVPDGYEQTRLGVEQRLKDIFIVEDGSLKDSDSSSTRSPVDEKLDSAIEQLEDWEPGETGVRELDDNGDSESS